MVVIFDSQAFVNPAADTWVGAEDDLSVFRLADDLQNDYLMADAFDSHPETEMDVDSPSCDYETNHMAILDELSKEPSCYPPQVWGEPSGGPSNLPWYGIVGNEISKSDQYWKLLETPPSTPPEGRNPVCPCPTALPSRPLNLSDHDVAAVSIKTHPYPPIRISHKTQMIISATERNLALPHATEASEPPSCDHTKCHPPLNVGCLSRRFEENQSWLRARAAAIAAQVHTKRGCKSNPPFTRPMTPKLTVSP